MRKYKLGDMPIHGWKKAGLLQTSIVRVHKIATLEEVMIEKVLGELQPIDKSNLKKMLSGLWVQ